MGVETSDGAEKYTTSEIYEHLFPNNRFQDLPERVFGSWLIAFAKVRFGDDIVRKIGFATAIGLGQEHAEREELGLLDKRLAPYYFARLEPSGRVTHPNFYNGRSFTDLLNDGESLGGVTKREVSWHNEEYLAANHFKLPKDLLFMDKPEIVIGVLDKKGHPAALIHMIEGKRIGVPVKSTVPEHPRSLSPVRF